MAWHTINEMLINYTFSIFWLEYKVYCISTNVYFKIEDGVRVVIFCLQEENAGDTLYVLLLTITTFWCF